MKYNGHLLLSNVVRDNYKCVVAKYEIARPTPIFLVIYLLLQNLLLIFKRANGKTRLSTGLNEIPFSIQNF